jgi:DNA transformation protein
MQNELQSLKNLGSTSVNWLRAVGINNRDELAAAGPIEVYNRIRERGFRVSRVLLYALEGALLDLHWNDLSPDHKLQLVTQADELAACAPENAEVENA